MNEPTRRAVFLDRDGVLNQSNVVQGKPYAPMRLEEFLICEDAYDSVRALKTSDFMLIVVTNQPDVGNGKTPRGVVEEMNYHLMQQLQIDALKVCYHAQTEGCACRKPKPGMLIDAAQEFDIDLVSSFMVGDRWSDVAAGKAAGCKTIFLDRDYLEPNSETPNITVKNLPDAVAYILAQ